MFVVLVVLFDHVCCCCSFVVLVIYLYFLIIAIIAKIYVPTAKLLISAGILTKEVNGELGTHSVTAEAENK